MDDETQQILRRLKKKIDLIAFTVAGFAGALVGYLAYLAIERWTDAGFAAAPVSADRVARGDDARGASGQACRRRSFRPLGRSIGAIGPSHHNGLGEAIQAIR